jgi:argininosuccinate lyase
MTLWSGRFESSMAGALWDLSESYSFDHVLYRHDLAGSRAHVSGLVAAGLLSEGEAQTLRGALDQIEEEFDRGVFVRGVTDEDVHMAIERRATELVGEVGSRLHTARSRNDQVATTLRLFTRDALVQVVDVLMALVESLVALGDRYPSASLPGYTHLQRAQPVLLSHHVGAHAWSLLRDVDRLLDTRDRLNVSPLGAGALAGTSLGVRPEVAAAELDFSTTFANSLDAVSDRDFVAESLFDLALAGVHLSRMGEELVLWTSAEFGFAVLGDEFTTGSSMLPHKKNSDVAELARGKAGRLVGNLTGLLVTLKGLPLSYNRDLQEDKEPLFDSLRQVGLVATALAGAYRSLEFQVERAGAAAGDELVAAIDLAERLVERGVPFRLAHETVGQWVAMAVSSGSALREVVAAHDDGADLAAAFAPGATLRSRTSPGASGPGPAPENRRRLDDAIQATRARRGT